MLAKLRNRATKLLDGASAIGAAFALPLLGIGLMLATKTNAGLDLEWNTAIGIAAGYTGTATATSATSLTATGTPWGVNAFSGMTVFAGSAYGYIVSNTSSVLTVDRWYNPASPGGAVASVPGSTSVFVIMPQSPPSQFMGLTANATAVGTGDTTLPSEITTAGGGLIRKVGTLAHTAGGATGTITGVFTANGSDSLPVTIAKMGIGPSLLSAANQLFQTILTPSTATLSAVSDQVTVTDTVTT
jgi:hypothetical protein